MGFVISFVAAWFTIFIFHAMNKTLNVMENAFVFLLALALGIHVSWIFIEELKWLTVSQEGLPYAGFLLFRSIFVPMVYVIMFNVIFGGKFAARTVFAWAAAIVAIVAVKGLLRKFGVYDYREWTVWYDALQVLAKQVICFGFMAMYRKLVRGEVSVR